MADQRFCDCGCAVSADAVVEQSVCCPLCGANQPRLRYRATNNRSGGAFKDDRYHCTSSALGWHGQIVQCQQCGMVYNNPQPTPSYLLEQYRKVEDPVYEQVRAGRDETFATALNQLQTFVTPPGKLLDVGCYTGVFLEHAQKSGWEVFGLELSQWAAQLTRARLGCLVSESLLHDARFDAQLFDVVTFWDVLEHLTDPNAFLKEVARITKSGGYVGLSTHVIDSLPVRLMGTRYPFFMEMHLVHFSRATLKQMLLQNGLELVMVKTHYRTVMLGYVLEKLAIQLGWLGAPLRSLAQREWVQQYPVRIGWLGLVNVFARRL